MFTFSWFSLISRFFLLLSHRDEIGTVNDLTITMVGDLKHGRTVHSLTKLLTLYKNINFRFVSPDNLKMPMEIKEKLQRCGLKFTEFDNIRDAIPDADILYVTRIQKERFDSEMEYEEACQNYVISAQTLYGAKETMKILHPLPRVFEIAPEIDNDQCAAYFRQAENGLYVRMALLALVLGRGS